MFLQLIREKRTGRPCDEASPLCDTYKQMGVGSLIDRVSLQQAMKEMPVETSFIGVPTPRSSAKGSALFELKSFKTLIQVELLVEHSGPCESPAIYVDYQCAVS